MLCSSSKLKAPLLVIFILITMTGSTFGQAELKKDTSEVQFSKLIPLITAETAFFVGGISFLQYVWYKDVPRVPFHFYDDNAGYNQMDKFGHAYGAYVESWLIYKGLRNSGVSKKNALIFGGPMGLILQTPIEIFDGLYEGWGFSKGDMIANAAGSALLIGQEILFDEQVLQYKFSYWRSPYAKRVGGFLGDSFLESMVMDYNGQTYWLSTNINRFFLRDILPSWLNLAVGYSAGGMYGEFKNYTHYRGQEIPETQRYRQFLLSFDLDCSKIKTKNKVLKKIFNSMVLVKIPAPAIEINTMGKVKAHWMYF